MKQIIAFVFFLFLAVNTEAATRYAVPSGGLTTGTCTTTGTACTLTYLISVCVAGDTCILRDGTYESQKILTVRSGTSAAAPIIFKAENPYQATVRLFDANPGGLNNRVLSIRHSFIEVYDLIFDGLGGASLLGVDGPDNINPISGVKVIGNIFQNGSSTHFGDVTGVEVSWNVFRNFQNAQYADAAGEWWYIGSSGTDQRVQGLNFYANRVTTGPWEYINPHGDIGDPLGTFDHNILEDISRSVPRCTTTCPSGGAETIIQLNLDRGVTISNNIIRTAGTDADPLLRLVSLAGNTNHRLTNNVWYDLKTVVAFGNNSIQTGTTTPAVISGNTFCNSTNYGFDSNVQAMITSGAITLGTNPGLNAGGVAQAQCDSERNRIINEMLALPNFNNARYLQVTGIDLTPTGPFTYYVGQGSGDLDSNSCTTARTNAAGSRKRTIAGGLLCLAAGDTLIITAGTYAEFIDSGQLVSGITAALPTTIQGASGEIIILRPTTGGAAAGVVWIQNHTNITFRNLDFDGVNTAGVGFYLNGGNETGIKIQDSIVRNSAFESCIVMIGSNHEVSGSTVHNCGNSSLEHGIYMAASDSLVERNTVYDVNNGYGIQAWKNTDTLTGTVVRRNLVYNAALSGYVVGNQAGTASGNLFHDNIVHTSGGGARIYTNSDNNQVYNNTFYNNVNCVEVLTGTNAKVQNNLCLSNTDNTIQDSGTATTADHNVSSTDTTLLVDIANGNFALKPSSSSLINQGLDLWAPIGCGSACTDYTGAQLRISPWDIGAFELGVQPALVLAMSLDSNVTDTSGFANNGTLTGGAYAVGKYNTGLRITTEGGVTVADSTSLNLSTGMTLEAWVNPSVVTGNRTIIGKFGAYVLYGVNSACGNAPRISVAISSVNQALCDSAALTADTFTHVAVTYDGASLVFYRNGAPTTSLAVAGSIDSSTNALFIANESGSEFFLGTLDEIRIYNYARTQAQITTDMNTAIGTLVGRLRLGASATAMRLGADAAIMKLQGSP